MKTPWKVFWSVVGVILAMVAYAVWKLLADKSGLEAKSRIQAAGDLAWQDIQHLKTPEEHKAEFEKVVEQKRVELEQEKRNEIVSRFENVFGRR